ncbi:hypothetical protein Tco_0747405 [Tanacetum coccineum]|uniref:Uncharacterized protein n=1 Tax=Tanacetum coccineum TaxID=301880 RepID=A0ABQ4YSQ6_9ASTR
MMMKMMKTMNEDEIRPFRLDQTRPLLPSLVGKSLTQDMLLLTLRCTAPDPNLTMDECHKLLTNKVDLVNPEGHQILRDIYEPLPLGGPPGDKERKTALSISKLKAARYLDFGLEELVPSLWVESERDYDISAAYGITHWWFRRKEFYINKHSEPSDREEVRSQMRILSVIRDNLKDEMERKSSSRDNQSESR